MTLLTVLGSLAIFQIVTTTIKIARGFPVRRWFF
ncbi:hypothetical protein ACVIF9_008023 [Bradyrhizobium sp. USDA 4350]